MATKDEPQPAKRSHKATYARDKLKGGYIIRVIGPNAAKFAGRAVPVVRMDDSESVEQLEGLIWTGNDEETGKPVALYHFAQRDRKEAQDEIPF